MPRLRTSSSSWQKFSTMRRMLPVITDSSITDGVDERELGRVDLGEVGLGGGVAGDAGVDVLAQPPLEFRHQLRRARSAARARAAR